MAPPQKAARPGEIWVAIATSSKRGWIRIAGDRAFAAAGIERHVAFEINDLQTILDLVDAGLGVAILPRSLAPLRTRLRFIRLRGKPPAGT
jgi:DNA-binding transcriptional LysR family regulator